MRRLLLLVPVLAIAAACRDSGKTPVVSGPTVADSADQILYQANIVLTTRGIERGTLSADTIFVLDEQTRFDLRRPHVVFTTETGAPQGTMDAKHGVYSTRTQILEGWGDVVAKLVNGRTLKSPHVVFNQVTHQLSSDTTYSITDPQGTQSGVGFVSNQAFTSFRCMAKCSGSAPVAIPTNPSK